MNYHYAMSRAHMEDHAVAHKPKDLQVVLKATRASTLRDSFAHQLCERVQSGPSVTMKCYPSTEKAHEWLSLV